MKFCRVSVVYFALTTAIISANALAQEPEIVPTKPDGPELREVFSSDEPPLFLDLEAAWRLAGIDNPEINRAKALIDEAQALQRQASLVWVPNLTAGVNYRYHTGVYQSSFGQIRDLSMQSLYVGSGANAVGGGPPAVAGVRLFTHLADALYDPLAARQMTLERRNTATAATNTVLLQTTIAYLELMAAEARIDASRRSYGEIELILDATTAYARTGQGRAGDAHRAESEGFLIVAEFVRLSEDMQIRSAELARQLHLDPATRLRTPGGQIATYDLVDLQRPLVELSSLAERWRPELSARTASVSQSQTRIRQEHARPFLPTLLIGYSAGGLGGTGNLTPAVEPFDSIQPRTDFDVWAFWTLRNGGLGNMAVADQRRAELGRRVAEREMVRAQIQNEVSEAYASAIARRRQLEPARRRLRDSEAGFNADYNRLRGGEGLPLESLNSMRLLAAARQEAVNVLVADLIAQFRLFVALGRPPYCATAAGNGFGPSSAPEHVPIGRVDEYEGQ